MPSCNPGRAAAPGCWHVTPARCCCRGPALLTCVLNTELQRLELVGEPVLSRALILVGVPGVAALLLSVPEEPAGAAGGERGHKVAPASLPCGHGQGPGAGSRKGQELGALPVASSSSPAPVVVLAEHGRVTHHDQQSLGPGDGHVKPLKRTSKRALPGCNTSHRLAAPCGCRQLWCGTEHPGQLYLPVRTRGKKGMPRRKGLLGARRYLGVLEEA